ncbi:MAG: hypothetical protein Fur0010_09340 [Bdellovibrio sp.]
MKKLITSICLLSSFQVLADSSTLLNQQGSEIDFSSQIRVQKQLVLNDPFLIQLYTTWKSLRINDAKLENFMNLVFDHQFTDALKIMPTIEWNQLAKIRNGLELYLLFQNGLVQNFVTKWIDVSSDADFLRTEIGLALDQVVSRNATQLLLVNGVTLTEEQLKSLEKIANVPSKFNYSLQAFKALRTGENAVPWIGKLESSDPLRMPLAQTAILDFAKQGKLGASGKLVKEVVEPILDNSSDEEEIALYFMTLGRLLYQAGALDEARKYYDLIPESSQYFLKARSEALWVHIREKNYSRTKGELATLEHKVFRDKFYPEAYVVSAMANVLLCQFVEARASINRFVESNKFWAKEINKNLKSDEPKVLDANRFVVNYDRVLQSIEREMILVKERELASHYLTKLENLQTFTKNMRNQEIKKQWANRKTILESALYKMNFVRIELISRMRQMALNQKIENTDEVSTFASATAKNNQLQFPNDGIIWSDDLFHMTAEVKNKCIKGDWK